MSKKQRVKLPKCQNCGRALDAGENFCPDCGQENDNKRQTFGHILVHLVESILHIDSKAALTLKPFNSMTSMSVSDAERRMDNAGQHERSQMVVTTKFTKHTKNSVYYLVFLVLFLRVLRGKK